MTARSGHRPREKGRRSARSSGVLFYQYGDFLQAVQRFDRGAPETYKDQRRSVDHVRQLAKTCPVCVISSTEASYHESLSDLRMIGLTTPQFQNGAALQDLVSEVDPAMAVIRTPNVRALQCMHENAVPTLALFADIFRPVSPKQMLTRCGLGRYRHNRSVARALNAPCVTAVANHSLAASCSLDEVLHVPGDKIVPWEWTEAKPRVAKRNMAEGERLTVVFAGANSEDKGLGDLLRAFSDPRCTAMHLDVFGEGPEHRQMVDLAKSLGVTERVAFHGIQPNETVLDHMSKAHVVVVPSRHSYPEGLPNVIYEALACRAALVLADHPAFLPRFEDPQDALFVPERSPEALARALERLDRDRVLAQKLSDRAHLSLAGLHVGMSWYDLVDSFVADPTNENNWVAANSLFGRGLLKQ